MLIPRQRFGSSVYNVPFLLALRFFYHASPFEATSSQVHQLRDVGSEANIHNTASPIISSSAVPTVAPAKPSKVATGISSQYMRLSTTEFLSLLETNAGHHASQRLVSLTWTKALGSPLSHESIQLIAEDSDTGHRSRLLIDRHVDGGDSVIIGFDWTAGEEPTQHHSLPLPLLSLEFDRGPAILDFARLLVGITNRKPKYSLLREMCWWYAEAVFETTNLTYGGKVKQWEFSHLRYSFVVRTNLIRREKLVRHAEAFRKMNIDSMIY